MKESKSSNLKQFLLSLLATTVSIVLTFGTSAVIEKRHKEAAKREMVMMIIYDFDKTIEQVQNADSLLHQANFGTNANDTQPLCANDESRRGRTERIRSSARGGGGG